MPLRPSHPQGTSHQQTHWQNLSLEVRPIGVLRSCYGDKFGTPRQSLLVPAAEGEIHLFPSFQPEESLVGLREGGYLWVLFWFHQNRPSSRFHAKVHPPRWGGRSLGVFASRSPHRPNPIGLSLLEIGVIYPSPSHPLKILVRGVDFVDGTPILDLKPYLPETESPSSLRMTTPSPLSSSTVDSSAIPSATPGSSPLESSIPTPSCQWTERAKEELLEVLHLIPHPVGSEFSPSSPSPVSGTNKAMAQLTQLIEDTLKLDPRPLAYRGYELSQNSPYRSSHVVCLWGVIDVHFRFTSPLIIEITQITGVS